MKYIKPIINNLIRKSDEYEDYVERFIVFEYRDSGDIYLAKLLDIDTTDYFLKIAYYELDEVNDEYTIDSVEAISVAYVKVLDSFDDLNKASKYYELMLKANKYNL